VGDSLCVKLRILYTVLTSDRIGACVLRRGTCRRGWPSGCFTRDATDASAEHELEVLEPHRLGILLARTERALDHLGFLGL
jgi:hypothetical protein